MSRRKVLITGIGGPAGKAAARYFGESGFHVIGMDMNENNTAPVDEFHKAYPAAHTCYLPQLLALAEAKGITLVVPTVSEELPQLAANRREFLNRGIQAYISRGNPVRICNDKRLTSFVLEREGIAIPRYASPLATGRYRETRLSNMKFPVLAKPAIGRGGRGIAIYSDSDELRKESRRDIIFQEFASGEDYDLNLCIDSQEPCPVLASQVLQKTSLKSGIVGNASSVKRVKENEVRELGVQAARALGLVGPLDIDIRKMANGQPVLLEINARLGANCLSAPEVLDALIWMWQRDTGNSSTHCIAARRLKSDKGAEAQNVPRREAQGGFIAS